MKPIATSLPEASRLRAEQDDFDWFDAYRIDVDDLDRTLTVWTACDLFLEATPFWVGWLFGIRNAAVRLVGLASASISPHEAKRKLRELESLSPESFPVDMGVAGGRVFFVSEREIVAGADDWHLDFRASILVESIPGSETTSVTATTLVRFNHWFGRLYFLPVKPFHKLIVRALLIRFVRCWNRRQTFGKKLEGR